MQLIDTHCHIHEAINPDNPQTLSQKKWSRAETPDALQLLDRAAAAGVSPLICVGTTIEDSELAVNFARAHDQAYASIGIHPHEAKVYMGDEAMLDRFAAMAVDPKVVAIGECGLDYFYDHSPRDDQVAVLRFQIELALKHHLPMIFHVRDAFDDFWPIFDEYQGLQGVIHSFTADRDVLEQALLRGLYVGLNGIMTFTKDHAQLAAAKAVPLDRLLLETDAPFLTPAPIRGTICEPKHVRVVAEFLAGLRGESLDHLAETTTDNARLLFGLR